MKTLIEIKEILQTERPYLAEKYGVIVVGVFGSYVRGEQEPDSDIDILIIQPSDLPPEILEPLPFHALPKGSQASERERILAALKNAGGNRTQAARLLGISRATFYRRLANLDLDPE